jgi:hypothetical protein
MMSLTLSQGGFQLHYVSHVNAIWLGNKEALADVLVQDLVVVCATMQLHESREKVERVLASWNDHG